MFKNALIPQVTVYSILISLIASVFAYKSGHFSALNAAFFLFQSLSETTGPFFSVFSAFSIHISTSFPARNLIRKSITPQSDFWVLLNSLDKLQRFEIYSLSFLGFDLLRWQGWTCFQVSIWELGFDYFSASFHQNQESFNLFYSSKVFRLYMLITLSYSYIASDLECC